MGTNEISLLYKFLEKSEKEAKKQVGFYEGKIPEEQFIELFEKTVIAHQKQKMERLDKALIWKDQLKEILKKHGYNCKPEKLDGNFFWITLRPADEHRERFGAFVIETNKYLQRAMFKNKIWCWEQKGEKMEDLGKGYHIHILAECRSNLMKTQLIKDTKSTFKRFLNGDVPDAFVQAEYVRTKEHYNNITAYMQGYKNDKWKDFAVALDPVWRARNNLNDIYGDTEDMLDPIPEEEVQNASN